MHWSNSILDIVEARIGEAEDGSEDYPQNIAQRDDQSGKSEGVIECCKGKNGKSTTCLIRMLERKTEIVREKRLGVIIGDLINLQLSTHAVKVDINKCDIRVKWQNASLCKEKTLKAS